MLQPLQDVLVHVMAEQPHFFNYLIALARKVYALYSPIIHIWTTLDEARRFQTINKPS
ncbi:hypothetical protein D3C71_2137190 [compost metagenome]